MIRPGDFAAECCASNQGPRKKGGVDWPGNVAIFQWRVVGMIAGTGVHIQQKSSAWNGLRMAWGCLFVQSLLHEWPGNALSLSLCVQCSLLPTRMDKDASV